jgi:hypothetical protein
MFCGVVPPPETLSQLPPDCVVAETLKLMGGPPMLSTVTNWLGAEGLGVAAAKYNEFAPAEMPCGLAPNAILRMRYPE